MLILAEQLYILDRPSSVPELREFLHLDIGQSQDALVFFTSKELALDYRQGHSQEGWELLELKWANWQQWLIDLFQGGLTHALIDPAADSAGEIVPIFHLLVES